MNDRRRFLTLLGGWTALAAFDRGLISAARASEQAGGTSPLKLAASFRPAAVRSLTYTQSSGYSRIVVECDGETSPSLSEVPADPANNKPDRVVLDLKPARKGPKLPMELKIGAGILLGVRSGQFETNTVRIVLDLAQMNKVGLTRLYDPFRIVLDIDGRTVTDLLTEGDDGPSAPEDASGRCV